METDDTMELLEQRRQRLEGLKDRLKLYKTKNLLLDEQKRIKQEQRLQMINDQARLDKERQELYAELQRQAVQPLVPVHSDTFAKVSEQEAIAWLRQHK
ncbi:hypothetical protein BC941DRAFT_424777, partial [Chlamydoabsidia padenii]